MVQTGLIAIDRLLSPVNIRTKATVLLAVSVLSACSSGSNAIVDTLQNVIQRDSAADQARLNPAIRYLRVTIGGRVALLALGYVDASPLGPIEVWYSAEREVLRIQNGRLAGAVGVTTEWRNVVLPPLPSWSAVAKAKDSIRWTRVRDVMPGYQYGVKDTLSLHAISAPPRSALRGLDSQQLTWFEEGVQAPQVAGTFTLSILATGPVLPPARYAVDLRDGKDVVVYGEQCLSKDLCFTWQRWPAGV